MTVHSFPISPARGAVNTGPVRPSRSEPALGGCERIETATLGFNSTGNNLAPKISPVVVRGLPALRIRILSHPPATGKLAGSRGGPLGASRLFLGNRQGRTGPILNFCRRLAGSSYALLNALQKPSSCLSKCFKSFRLLLHHGPNHEPGAFPNDGKSKPEAGNFTARDGNYAC